MRALVPALLLTLAGCGAYDGDPPAPEESPGKADDFGEVNPASEVVEELAERLRADGAVPMPPRGREFGANHMEVTVEVVPVPGDDLRALVRERVCEIGARYQSGPCDPNFPLFAHPDVHALYQSGFRAKAIRTYLLRSLVTAEHRAPIEAIVNRFAWTFVRLTIHDLGAGIVGDELIILHACCSNQPALVLRVAYHAG